MNGQRERQRMVRELASAVDFDEIVETGTYRGASTLFFSHAVGVPVHSVELLDRYFRYSERRCSRDPNISLKHGDSRAFLQDLSKGISDHTTFFYLDAHWEQDVPRLGELEIIADGWQRAVVMIDDFLVSDDDGYRFTKYGGNALDLTYLPPLEGWKKFYPAASADEETGARRGCLVLASSALAPAVEALQGLRPVNAAAC